MTREDLKKCKLPDGPGVYLFKKGRKILYIGKAASLRDRVRSYFSSDLGDGRSPAIVKMVTEADKVSYTTTGSVLEALILEANLIKHHQPPANVDEKDNKSFNYLVITKEPFPRVLVVRGRELFQKFGFRKPKYEFGPFPGGMALREAIKIVRKIFPFRDSKCVPCEQPSTKGYPSRRVTLCKPCFNRHIGLCPGVCTGEVSEVEYAVIIKHIKELFSGNFKGLKRQLSKEMQAAAKAERFEEAAHMRRQIGALEHIRDVSLIKSESRISSGGGTRIEAFDVAHTHGSETVGVMTVVQNGEMIKAAYRKFKITSAQNDDVAALKEVLSRRLAHNEWPLPRVFVVDGGTAQMRAAKRVLSNAGVMIPIVGVVKNEFHKPERLIGDRRSIEAFERDILLANYEAHRCAIGWHRQRRRKRML
ncbi:MAG: UvrB/UvrC motif-containing protein [bacterium]|nr:UvrB/UvrC motif-containing protein [bacterium]